jgi:hypothetical protein
MPVTGCGQALLTTTIRVDETANAQDDRRGVEPANLCMRKENHDAQHCPYD